MTDIVAFLNARLDEDEAIAQAAANESHEATWDFSTHGDSVHTTEHGAAVVVGPHEYLDETIQRHIARHDPARVLAEVAAKRQIIQRYERALTVIGAGHGLASFTRGQDDGYRQGCLDALHDLALPYADHPDYRPEWRA